MTAAPSFESALAAIRSGAHYSIEGMTLTVNGIALAVTDEEFDRAWDVMNETNGGLDEAVIALASPSDLLHPSRASRTASDQ